MKVRIAIGILLGIWLPFVSVNAQDGAAAGHSTDDSTRPGLLIGPYLGLNLNLHSSDFAIPAPLSALPDPAASGTLDDGSLGLGLNAGGLIEYRLSDWLGISGRIGYNNASGELAGNGSVAATSATLTTEQTLDASLAYLDITPLALFYEPFGLERFYGLAGLNLAVPLSSSYTQNERISLPEDAAFADGEATREYANDAEIADAATRLALTLGLGYNYQLGDKLWLAPEVQLRFPFTKVSGADALDSWNVPQLRLAANLKFDISSEEEEAPEEVESDSELDARMDEIVYYDDDGQSRPLKIITVEDLQYSEMYPLIPYVFFEKDKGSLNTKYQVVGVESDAGEFAIGRLPQDALSINRNTLNIIGRRMEEYPNARLTIVGTNDGKSETDLISKARAEAVKTYLTDNFDIDAQRLSTEARGLPAKYSSQSVAEGDAENRRVEFRATPEEVLDPIMIEKDKQRISSPHLIEFRPFASSKVAITQWTLTISQAGKVLREFTRNGEPKSRRWIIRPNELAASQLPVEYTLDVADESGARKQISGTIPVDYLSNTRKSSEQLPDRTVEKFSLILFDFDSSDLTGDNARILERSIVPAIKYNSTVKIVGYADLIGDETYNRKLSQRRAESIQTALQSKVKASSYTAQGAGEVPIFDNETPMGRNLCRTVQIIIETPR